MNYSFIKDRHSKHYKTCFRIVKRNLSFAKIVIKNYNYNNSLRKGYVLLWDYMQKVVYLQCIN